MDLESVAEELYTLHPTEFVGARTARVEAALAAGKAALAAQIAALKRPTLSAWAGNLLVHSEPRQVARLLRLGEGLRSAHQKRARTQLRRLGRQQHTLVAVLTEQARLLAAEAGHPIGQAAQGGPPAASSEPSPLPLVSPRRLRPP
ncbi:hypothetical protein [Streptomyces spiralis]|uniref:hypothetical protein n=1 Tax=Streptomyces spiralis TaxID=66376 RepID=UPI00335C67E6